jgi:RNA polymerase sigma factor (sigma-70 family)
MANLLRTPEINRLANASIPSSDDAELLNRYRDTGDADAFESIVRRHARTVLGVCQRMLHDSHAAEDAFQATFLQLARKAHTLRSPVVLAAWLYATARRTALRHRQPGSSPLLVEQVSQAKSPLDLLTARELLAAIEDEIARFPEKYQLPLVFCYLDGLKVSEAADRLGLSVGVVRGMLERGREKLRLALTRRGFAPVAVLAMLCPCAGPASAELVRHTMAICVGREPTSTAIALLAASRPSVLVKAAIVAGVLLFGGLGLIAATGQAEAPTPQSKPETPRPANSQPQTEIELPPPAESQLRHDLLCDPLPPNAIARMGSTRWRHVDDVRSRFRVVTSPTGKLIATVSIAESGDGLVRVWDLTDGRQLCEFPRADAISGRDVKFTPDGSQLMIVAPRGVVYFHDPQTGKVLAKSKPVIEKDDVQLDKGIHRHSNTWHELTEDCRWILTWSNKPILTEIVTDPSARPRQVVLEEPAGVFTSRDFDPFTVDGNTLVGCYTSKDILRWDIRTGKLCGKTRIKFNDMVLRPTRDGKRVVTWRQSLQPGEAPQVWDTETGAEVVKLQGAESQEYRDLRFSPDGKRIVAAVRHDDKTLMATVWELEHGKIVGQVKIPSWCFDIFLLADGKTILATSDMRMFGTWDIETGRRLSPITGHESDIQHLAFATDGKTLLTSSASPDERYQAWEAMSGKRLQELTGTHGTDTFGWVPRGIGAFVLTPAGVVISTENGALAWIDLKTGRELRRFTPGHIASEPFAKHMHEESVTLTLDPRTGKPAVFALFSYGSSPLASCSSKDWKEIATLLDAESGEVLAHRSYTRHYMKPSGIVSPDGQLLARQVTDPSTRERWVLLDSARSGSGGFKLKHPDILSPHYLFTPDGQTLITGTKTFLLEKSDDAPETSTIRLWEVRSGKQRLAFAIPVDLPALGKGARFAPLAYAVSRDGRFLASAWTDNVIRVWDLTNGTEVAKRSGYKNVARTLAFRPDGKALASGHSDGTALVWDLSGLPDVKQATTDREVAWKALASSDAEKAYQAILSLSADPKCVAFLRDKVKPATAVPAGQIQNLVKELDNDEFTTREAATQALTKLGDVIDGELRVLLRGELSAEQHRRILEVLAKRNLTESDQERLRALRCVEVLERVGSAEARAVLGELAKGLAGARLTREAANAIRRMNEKAQ